VSRGANETEPEPIGRMLEEMAAVWAEIDALRAGEDLLPEGGFEDPPLEPDGRKFFDI
jgi:hypothetical protein